MNLHVSQQELQLILAILAQVCPPNAKVIAFGSRVNGQPRQYSDLDLAIDLRGRKLTLAELTGLKDSFTESDLPYSVDIVDLASVPDSFKAHILQHGKLLFESC